MGRNAQAAQKLKEEGSCDFPTACSKVARFRVNIFHPARKLRDRDARDSELGAGFRDSESAGTAPRGGHVRNGIVLVTGPTGSGKSSTLAAILNKINQDNAYHIITIEDPIEFLHAHKTSTVHQRELHSDTPSFALALRAALRQAPEVILGRRNARQRDDGGRAGSGRDGPPGFFHASHNGRIENSRTHHRRVSAWRPERDPQPPGQSVSLHRFSTADPPPRRHRAHRRIRDSQIHRCGRANISSTARPRGKASSTPCATATTTGMQHFDQEIEKLIRAGLIDIEVGLSYATNVGNCGCSSSTSSIRKEQPQE